MSVQFSVGAFAAWAPGVESAEDWREWAAGRRQISGESEPALRAMAPLLADMVGRTVRLRPFSLK